MEETNNSDWSVENTTIAILLLLGHQGKITNDLSALSAQVAKLIREGILEAHNWGLQRTAAGYYAQTLDEFLGASILAGDAKDGSQFKEIKLKEGGVKTCREIIVSSWRKGDREKIEQILKTLGVDSVKEVLDTLCA